MVNLLGLAAIIFFGSSQAASVYGSWWATERSKSEITHQTDLEKTQVVAARELADTYAANQIADIEKVILVRYTYSDRPPRVDWGRSVNPIVKTMVFDKHRRCVGYAYQGEFYFLRHNPEACNGG